MPAWLRQGFVEVVPIGVLRDDEIDLPGARPVLHGPLALDGRGNALVALRVDESGQTVPLGEPLNQALAVFPRSTHDVIGDTEIERAVGSVGHDVDPACALSHASMLQAVDARIKSTAVRFRLGQVGVRFAFHRLAGFWAGP